MNEINLDHKSCGPAPTCPRCGGRGSYIDPPLAQQEREKSEGKRRWIIRKVCSCIGELKCHSTAR